MGAGFSTGGGQSKGGMSRPAPQSVQYPMPAGYDPNVHQPSIGFVPGFEPASGPSQTQQPMNQIGDMGFVQPDQASMQAQMDDLARRRADPAAMQAQMMAMELQGRRQVAQPMQSQVQQSPFGRPMQYRPPMQQPYQQPYYQQRMQPNMFGGLASLMPFLRRQY